MDWVFLNFSEAEVGRIDWPVVRTNFLFSWVVVFMRLKIHLSHLLFFWHIFSRVNGLLDTPPVLLSRQSELKILVFGLLWEVIVSIYRLRQRLPALEESLPFKVVVLAFFEIIDEVADATFLPSFDDIVSPL